MADPQTYVVTPLAGERVAGILHGGVGTTVSLTPFAAAYELIQGNLVPEGTPVPIPLPQGPVAAIDRVAALRGGQAYDFLVSELAAFIAAGYAEAVAEVVRQRLVGGAGADLDDLGKVGLRLAELGEGMAEAEGVVSGLSRALIVLRDVTTPALVEALRDSVDGRLNDLAAAKLDAAYPVFASAGAALDGLPPGTWTVAEIGGRLSLWANQSGLLVDLRAGLVTTSSLDA